MSEDTCGETFDHDLDSGEHADGISVYICRVCGAEIIEDAEVTE